MTGQTDSIPQARIPAAHRALFVAEIAEKIALDIVASPKRSQKTNIVSLALTCKALSRPALNARWREVHNFNELLRCFSQGIWQVVPCEARFIDNPTMVKLLEGSEQAVDFSHFEENARQVYSLDMNDTVLDVAFLRVILTQRRSYPLFPNIRHLVLQVSQQNRHLYEDHFPVLLGPHLHSCRIYDYDSPAEPHSYLQYLHERCPQLNVLHISTKVLSDKSEFWSFQCLTELYLGAPIGPVTLDALSLLPQLKSLEFDGSSPNLASLSFQTKPGPLFPSLQNLTISNLRSQSSAQNIVTFLCGISGTALRTIWITQSEIPSAPFPHILDALGKFVGLEEITIDMWAGRFTGPVVDWAMLALLQQLNKLKRLDLRNVSFALTVECIPRIGAAWPHLNHLFLQSGDYPDTNRILDLEDLGLFAVHCPDLTTLAIPFEVSAGFMFIPSVPPLCAPRLKSLGIPQTEFEDASPWVLDEVAAFLHGVFPNAKLNMDDLKDGGFESSEETLEAWREVDRIRSRLAQDA